MAWFDLTQPFHADMPHSAGLADAELETLRCVERDGVNVQRYGAPVRVLVRDLDG